MINIKEFIWNILFKNDDDFINSHVYDLGEYRTVIEKLETEVSDLTMKISGLQEAYDMDMYNKDKKIEELNLLVKRLKLPDSVYEKPSFLNNEIPFNPRTIVAANGGDVVLTLNPKYIYSTTTLIKEIVDMKNWKELYLSNKKECAHQIWDYVIHVLTYEYDKVEDWRTSTISLAYQKGDCEDGTILFLDLAHEAGFTPEEVFNAAGYFHESDTVQYGHSFPIVNYGSGWFVYESTLDSTPNNPKRLLGSKYTIDWGCANWAFAGKLKDNKLQI